MLRNRQKSLVEVGDSRFMRQPTGARQSTLKASNSTQQTKITGMGYPMTVFLIGASVSGVMLGATNRIIFLLPAALMALVVASVLIVRSDIDLGLTALTATLFCSGYLLGVVMANTRPRLFVRLAGASAGPADGFTPTRAD